MPLRTRTSWRGVTLDAPDAQDTVRVMLDPAGHPFCLYLDE
jgi:hypothetical protein